MRRVGLAHERDELLRGRRVDEPRRRAAEAQRRQLAQRRRLGHRGQASGPPPPLAGRGAPRRDELRVDADLRPTTDAPHGWGRRVAGDARVAGHVAAHELARARQQRHGQRRRGPQAKQVRNALTTAGLDMTTLAVDQGRLMDAVSSYPIVHSLRTSTDFPHKLRIVVNTLPADRRAAHPGRARRRRLRRHDPARQRDEGPRPRRRQDDPRRRPRQRRETRCARSACWRPRRVRCALASSASSAARAASRRPSRTGPSSTSAAATGCARSGRPRPRCWLTRARRPRRTSTCAFPSGRSRAASNREAAIVSPSTVG